MKTTNISIVLLPGLHGTAGLFKPLIETAPPTFNIICIEYPTQTPNTYDELTAFVLHELNKITGKYILIGESFSGPISLFISRLAPPGLWGTILVATFISAPHHKIGRLLPWTRGFQLVKPLYRLRIMLSTSKNTAFLQATATELEKVSPKVLASRIQQIFAVDATSALAECRVPIAYFRGNSDFIVPQRNLNKIISLCPNIKVYPFDTQHFLLQSAPKAAWDAITNFVEGATLA